MRGYKVVIPKNCVAALTKNEHQFALQQMQRVFHAEIGLNLNFTRTKRHMKLSHFYALDLNRLTQIEPTAYIKKGIGNSYFTCPFIFRWVY